MANHRQPPASVRENSGSWHTQRTMMERLHEEVARAERYKTPLSLALGVIKTCASEEGLEPDVMDKTLQAKRRSDVAGQYGPHGVMLLLPGTSGLGAAVCCRRLQGLLEQPSAVAAPGPEPAATRTYFGIASYSAELDSAVDLLCRAEQCLAKAQTDDGVRVVF